jgi:uncharacterized membrane-anchored protein YhcB (DUF1043 family)
MSPDLIGYLVAAGIALAAAAFFVGRSTGAGANRRRELEEQLADAQEELARAAADAEDLLEQLGKARDEHSAYRLNVMEHFSGTSDLLRDLTVQYRSVYEHLTKGASTLCPEGFVALTQGLPVPQIAEPPADRERAADVESSAPAAREEAPQGDAPPPPA